MKLLNIAIDIESIEECEKRLRDKSLQELCENFKLGYENILSTFAFPIAVASHSMQSMYEFEYRLKAATQLKTRITDDSKEFKDLVNEHRLKDRKKGRGINEASKMLKNIGKELSFLDDTINQITLNSLVNSWTIFESIMKDTWIHLLNSDPKRFLSQTLLNNDGELPGIEGKNISIGLLQKFDLDVSKHLGDLLHKKYDFTSVRGIKKAYSELFKKEGMDFSFLENKTLCQLEIARHITVHKGGIIDEEYLKRTTYKNEKLGHKLDYSARRCKELINSPISIGTKLFLIVDTI